MPIDHHRAAGLALPPRRRFLLTAGAFGALAATAGCASAPAASGPRDPAAASVENAFYYGFGPFEFARSAQRLSAPLQPGGPSRLNTLTHRAALADHRSREVTAPNNDTIYSSAILDLSRGPVELYVPTDRERYFSVALMSVFTDNFAYVGTRETGGEGGFYWIAGPDAPDVHPSSAKLIRAPSNDVWLLARILVDGPDDLAAARALQQQIKLATISGTPPPRPWTVAAAQPVEAANFLDVVNETLGRSPTGAGQAARAARFAAVGVRPGETGVFASLPAEVQAEWTRFIPQGIAALRGAFVSQDRMVDGWGYPMPELGNFGESDFARASVALGGLAALELKEAFYITASRDAAGRPLTGAHRYRLRLPPGGVPANAFWSLTMYQAEEDGRFFYVENPINRFSIGDRTPGLTLEPDGSLVIAIQRERPETRAENWLPAPAGPFRTSLRAYLPKPELLDGSWRAPGIERL